ncbi:MAG: hypothetical protein Q7S66_03150 [bacterium]|nr:hypothetical protein [bacterium]
MLSEKSAFRQFNLSVFLHFIGRGLYAIFVPIILLKNNYPLEIVLALILCSSFVTVLTSYLSERVFRHKRAILFNILAVMTEIFLIILLSYNYISIYIFLGIITCEGLYYGFYYISYRSIINHYTSHKKIGKNLGNINIALTVAGIITPVVGALLLDINTIYLIIIIAVFLALSIVPLIQLTDADINGQDLPVIPLKTAGKELLEFSILSGIEIIVFNLWAIYAFINNISLVMIGTIAVAGSVANIFITEELKERLNKARTRRNIKILVAFIIMAASVYRYILPGHILATNIVFGAAFLLMQLSIDVSLLNKLKGYQTYRSSAIISVVAFMSRAVMVILAFVLGLKYIILAPIVLCLGYVLLIRKELNR